MATSGTTPIDGRRARRERSRLAIIDAVFAAIGDGKVPPTADDIAGRAGVSVSSIFRNFDGLDDMQSQAFVVFQERYSVLLDPVDTTDMSSAQRVAAHVRVRLELVDAAGPLIALARQRAIDYGPMADAVGRSRSRLVDQTRAHFREEAAVLTPAGSANLLSIIDSLTSPDAHQLMGAANGRSHRQIGRAWTTALGALLAGWPGLPATEPEQEPST